MRIVDKFYIYCVKKFLIPEILDNNPGAKLDSEPRITHGGLYLPAHMLATDKSVFCWKLPNKCSAIFRPSKNHYIVWHKKIAIEVEDVE